MITTSKYLSGGHQMSGFNLSATGIAHRYNGNLRQTTGFTLIELLIVVGIIGLLSAIAVPNLVHSRGTAQTDTCISNLRQLDECKQQWAMENQKTDDSIPTVNDVTPYLRGSNMPTCPASGDYHLRRVARPPICTLSPDGHTLKADEDTLPD